jgi:uncharacterized membrane protein YkvA (DUF1232 family)
MSELNENDRERIHSTFEYGTETFTEADLEKVRENRDAAEKKAPFLKDQFGIFVLLWSLLQDYWSGEYKAVPWKLIASIGFAATYLVSPLDIVPDFIPLLGFVDDAAVFGLVASSFQSELDAYKKWKEEQGK